MPCKREQARPLSSGVDEQDGFTVAYTVRPSWGRCRRVYLLDSDAEGSRIHFQSAADLPENIRHSVNERHRIFPEYPTVISPLTTATWTHLKRLVDGIALPVLGEFTGGFDGTHYYLRIERAMTSIEFHWWLDLPERWLPLLDVVAAIAQPFASPDFDDSHPKRTEAEQSVENPETSTHQSP